MQKAGKGMRIGIDVRYLSHGIVGGVHTYIHQFVPAVIDAAQCAGGHEIFLYADTKRPFELDEKQLPAHVTLRKLRYRNPLSSVHLDLSMRDQMAQDKIDVAHFPANYGFGPARAKTIVTLHDSLTVLPLRQTLFSSGSRRTLRSAAMTVYLKTFSSAAVKRATLLFTVSEHARQDIAKQTGIAAERILPIPHAPTPDMRRIEDPAVLHDTRVRLELPGRFVLADGLKNPAVLVRAWRLLPEALRSQHKIVFFSRRPDPLPVIFEAVNEGIAQLLIRPSREDLIALYSMADAFVFPSWFEGFGIPVLEAMTCGAPVIASDRYSIPEVAGGAALIADAEDEAGFAAHLTRVLANPAEADRLRRLGHARAAQFSWEKTAQQILKGYEMARDCA
jgi:glycosyltransferase involved in cell wall biosynthesis